jgi:hypothetical protein
LNIFFQFGIFNEVESNRRRSQKNNQNTENSPFSPIFHFDHDKDMSKENEPCFPDNQQESNYQESFSLLNEQDMEELALERENPNSVMFMCLFPILIFKITDRRRNLPALYGNKRRGQEAKGRAQVFDLHDGLNFQILEIKFYTLRL